MAGGTMSGGVLSMVGTPIGNLGDASPRVVETLRGADLLLCEDTRVTSKLLSHFGIRLPLKRADENVLSERIPEVLERLEAGERVAFVSDAGMPGVSDPGQRLVDAALEAGLRVEVIPGPSAVTCALVASGLPMEHFFFEGFLPRKKGPMAQRLHELSAVPGALVFYESPRRVVATLAVMAEVFPGRRIALVRELTKLHEEVVRGLTRQVADELAARDEVKGECVLVLEGPVAGEEDQAQVEAQTRSLDEAIAEGLAAGERASALAKRLAKAYGISRADVYDLIASSSR